MNDTNPYRGAFRVFGACKDFTEIRILNTPTGTVSGIFSTDDARADALMHEIRFRKLEHYTVYQVLNNLSDEYRTGKHCNVLMPYAKNTAKDADVRTLNYIMTDFDPVRPSHTSATATEKAIAKKRLLSFLSDMKAEGMIPAIVTDSGNGYNAYFRVDLPNTQDNVKLIKNYNTICHNKYTDNKVDFDRAVTNPSRLAKLPGTWAFKGTDTPERPHRQSKILMYQSSPQPIPKSLLAGYIRKNTCINHPPVRHRLTSFNTTSGSGQTALLQNPEAYVQVNGWSYRIKDCDKGRMYILDTCPFNPAHNNASAFILVFGDGKAMFKCHHNSCADRSIRDLLAMFPNL